MSERDPDELLAGFAAELEGGGAADPREWISRAAPGARQKLAAAIDHYLMTAPRRAWDPDAYESSIAKVAVDRVYESIDGVSGSWPELLPALRNRARIKRSELVERLAEVLGVGTAGAQIEKVGGYYNRMEHGLLPAEGVSGRVLDALAQIVGASAEVIARAGGGAAPSIGEADAASPPVYARLADAGADPAAEAKLRDSAPGSAEAARDEIDELFTAG